MTLKKTNVALTDAVIIDLKGHQRVKDDGPSLRFERAQDDLLSKFLAWMLAHPEIEIHLQSSGMGSCVGWAPIYDREVIEEFFRSEGAMP